MNDFRELVDVEMESTDTTSTPVVSPLPIAAHRLMLRKGDRGESVKEMQRGIGGLTADGLFGPATDRRVRAWQKENGLVRSEEHTSELQSLMRISYAVFCLKKKTQIKKKINTENTGHNEVAIKKI